MVEKLQSQVAMYEDYEHTGNDILDIILKEKSETAREKHIALSVTADLNGVDFIELWTSVPFSETDLITPSKQVKNFPKNRGQSL